MIIAQKYAHAHMQSNQLVLNVHAIEWAQNIHFNMNDDFDGDDDDELVHTDAHFDFFISC